MRITPLVPALGDAWAALFEACGSGCYCRYWHFAGNKNEWLARTFEHPGTNRDEQLRGLAEGAPEARGLVALEGDAVVGWMKLAPRTTLSKLTRQGTYRSRALGTDDGVWSIGCLLVHPAHRRRDVARRLIEGADDAVRAWGGSVIEAYPHRAAYALRDEEAWMGPESLYRACGFVTTDESTPYPIYRKTIRMGSQE